ncbi:MAG: ABC transporter permease [Bacillota bacterium]|nr:ABC transporter permease [Bacillota bacterium]
MKNLLLRLSGRFFLQLLKMLALLLAVSIIAFALISASPIDPVQQYILNLGTAVSPEQRAEIAEYWEQDTPPLTRYLSWLSHLLRGDLGESSLYRRPVAEIIGERFWNSISLMLCAWLFAGLIGFSLGCLMAMNEGKWADRFLKRLCYVLSALPSFWLGLVLLLLFSVWLPIFPIGFSGPIGMLSENISFWQRLHHLFLPALTLSLLSFGNVALHTREKLIDVLHSDYVLFARARAAGKWKILQRHGLRNILLPALTLQFSSFAELFGGSVLAETVFSFPGLGSAVAAAGLNSDVPLLLGISLFSALFVSVGNMIAELLYGLVDPRIREAAR